MCQSTTLLTVDFKRVASLDPKNSAVKSELEECVRKEMAKVCELYAKAHL